MRRLTITILGIAIALSGAAQSDYVDDWNPDADGDGNVGVTDLLALLSVFSENDVDGALRCSREIMHSEFFSEGIRGGACSIPRNEHSLAH